MKRHSLDQQLMRSALSEARKGLGLTSPNPAVGAILAIGNQIVARGHHRAAGFRHAEIECLRNFDRAIPSNATLYVTLEPCSTVGRMPACTGQILQANIKKIVIGAIDPNPQHSGRGLELLRKAGVEVRTGVLTDECVALNEAFNKWIVTGIPFVIAKCAMTLDGKLTRPPAESRRITGSGAKNRAHKLRAAVDAILVGAETVRTDNPRLTVRAIRSKHQPLRVVLTRSGNLPRRAHILTDRFAAKTLVFRSKPLKAVLSELGKKDVTSVLIEGGGQILTQALEQRVIDKLQICLGPMISGGPVMGFGGSGAGATSEAVRLKRVCYERLGDDLCVTGYPNYPGQAE